MTTLKKYRVVRQTISEPPPGLLQMVCQCGEIFSQSLRLTTHIFEKHIYSPQFQTMKSITEQLQTIGDTLKSEMNNHQKVKQNQQKAGEYVEDISFSCYVPQRVTKAKAQIKEFKQTQELENRSDQILGLQSKVQKDKIKVEGKVSLQGAQLKQNLSQNTTDNKQNEKNASQSQIHPRRQPAREFYNSRIFMCGQCLTQFVYSAELNIHVSVQHNGQYPDGCIFGLKKTQILKFFNVPCQKPVFPQAPERQRKFKCGCGSLYSASSSLMNHIKMRHNSVAPPGTINLAHTRRIKKITAETSDLPGGV